MSKPLRKLARKLPTERRDAFRHLYTALTSLHIPGKQPNVLVFTTPRSGSTWLMELILSQPGFKAVNEPLDVRNPKVVSSLKLATWEALQSAQSDAKIERYLKGYLQNRVHVAEPLPWQNPHYRFLTRRIVFKLLHGGESRVARLAQTLNGKVVIMVRHPIPVSLSRNKFPRLESFLAEDYKNFFTAPQLQLARRIIASGTKMEKGVLDWCFQNAIPLKQMQSAWTLVTYEQLVLEPESAVNALVANLELNDKRKILENLSRVSGVVRKSDAQTKELHEQGYSQERQLSFVTKWRAKVSAEEETALMDILKTFEIDLYQAGNDLPAANYWIGEHYAEVAALLRAPQESAAV